MGSETGERLAGIRQAPHPLARQLRELETDGILTRTVHASVPPRVDYELTPKGGALAPILLALRDWGAKHVLPAGDADPGRRPGPLD